jgi:hypothetical protein
VGIDVANNAPHNCHETVVPRQLVKPFLLQGPSEEPEAFTIQSSGVDARTGDVLQTVHGRVLSHPAFRWDPDVGVAYQVEGTGMGPHNQDAWPLGVRFHDIKVDAEE